VTPAVELIGDRIRIGSMLLTPDDALRLAHRIADLLTPSFTEPSPTQKKSTP
jgi:hypothetical protein